MIKSLPFSGEFEEFKGLDGIPVAEAKPLQDPVNQIVGEENPGGVQGLDHGVVEGRRGDDAEDGPDAILEVLFFFC